MKHRRLLIATVMLLLLAGHGFSGGNFDLAMDYILDYLSNQLN